MNLCNCCPLYFLKISYYFLQSHPIPYHYGYDIHGGDKHTEFKQTRQEVSDGHGNVKGSYGYTDQHGNLRQVEYIADHHGFRAQVKTNEPGTDKQSPADVHLEANPPKYHPEPVHYESEHGHEHGGY